MCWWWSFLYDTIVGGGELEMYVFFVLMFGLGLSYLFLFAYDFLWSCIILLYEL